MKNKVLPFVGGVMAIALSAFFEFEKFKVSQMEMKMILSFFFTKCLIWCAFSFLWWLLIRKVDQLKKECTALHEAIVFMNDRQAIKSSKNPVILTDAEKSVFDQQEKGLKEAISFSKDLLSKI